MKKKSNSGRGTRKPDTSTAELFKNSKPPQPSEETFIIAIEALEEVKNNVLKCEIGGYSLVDTTDFISLIESYKTNMEYLHRSIKRNDELVEMVEKHQEMVDTLIGYVKADTTTNVDYIN